MFKKRLLKVKEQMDQNKDEWTMPGKLYSIYFNDEDEPLDFNAKQELMQKLSEQLLKTFAQIIKIDDEPLCLEPTEFTLVDEMTN